MPSFDVVSEVDMQEVDNAVNQARKEISNRYDFRNSKSEIVFDKQPEINLVADDKMKLEALSECLKQKLSKRGVGLKSLDFQEPQPAGGSTIKQLIKIKQGISTDDGKKIVKAIKEKNFKKVQAQIQQEQVRVTAPKRDELQAVIQMLKEEIELELQFTNFKD